ncbi:hypothetical protein BOTBODRAFT_52241 [Botryobasidium botryosum FD-172 SS1]|uniref:Uncharacterized protein n=1 Tax=Botryobasidium botryosum (strain FD-172 SS1) TaxID=930990 RepID=A0A067N4J1_BOTB1|nr:hypothetical protein BOTBODRAFT_52241 [Botryobasidium botryosum FD-172 SS1]
MGHSPSSLNTPLSAPPGYRTPSFPSLYNPSLEFRDEHGSHFLYKSSDIFRFTLYWTMIFYLSMYAFCGAWALIARRKPPGLGSAFVFLAFVFVGMFLAVLGSVVIGYVLAAVYSVGNFNVSTWVPFQWALIQTLVSILGSYPSIVTLL